MHTFLGAALILPAAGAAAQDKQILLSTSTRYDDNIRRSSSTANGGLGHDGADIVTYVGASGRIDTRIGMFDLALGGNAGQSLFWWNNQFNALDYGAEGKVQYDGARGTVVVEGGHRRRPIALDEVTSTLNLRQYLTQANAEASREVLGALRVVGHLDYQRSHTSSETGRRNDTRTAGFGGGIGYFSPTGNHVTLEYRERRAVGLLDSFVVIDRQRVAYRSRFRETSLVSRLLYAPSVVTRIEGSLGYTRHDDRSVLETDFTGLLADVSVTWSPTASLTVTPRLRKAFGTENALFSNGVEVTSYGFGAKGVLGANIGWSAYFNREKRRFRYDLRADDPLLLARSERTDRMGLGLSYSTGMKIQVALNYERTRRVSGLTAFAFTDNAITLSLSRGLEL
ncbi:outer membrane beta-barrel protein [Novosphingobium resinovorum]|uniref:outer membrane beta-barrel protein n=1 Tax=Novosphingobium resinovorum TaxID=158500 RepID=UPI002ECFF9D0|nr:outer membrane beta-barrel protein [Novosphingobium resinovorum]